MIISKDDQKIIVKILPKEGPYKPPARELVIKIFTGEKPQSVILDGQKQEISADSNLIKYDISAKVIKLAIKDDFSDHEINIIMNHM